MKSCKTCKWKTKFNGCYLGWCINYDRYEPTKNIKKEVKNDFIKEEEMEL